MHNLGVLVCFHGGCCVRTKAFLRLWTPVCVSGWKPADSLRRAVLAAAADMWPEAMGCREAVGQGEEMLLVPCGAEKSSWPLSSHVHVQEDSSSGPWVPLGVP